MTLTCWRAVVAHRCAGAAPVRVGRLGGEAQWAATAPHVVHVVVGLVHGAGGEAGGDGSLVGQRAGHQTGGVLQLVGPLAQWHHLWGTQPLSNTAGGAGKQVTAGVWVLWSGNKNSGGNKNGNET